MADVLLSNVVGLDPGEEVELYKIDLSPAGWPVQYYFTPSSQQGDSLWHGGQEYVPRPINITGLTKSSEDGPAEPTLGFGNIDKGGTALLKEYNDLLGAKITRKKTFAHFLDKLADGSPNPNADQYSTMLPEVWFIEQKVGNTPAYIQLRLRSILDLNGKMIPARLVLKNICRREYRVWNSAKGTWDYATKRACPYAGNEMFDRNNEPTDTPSLDQCPKNLTGCNLRFAGQTLPGWFFPGVTRLPS